MHALQAVAAKAATVLPAADIPKPETPSFLKGGALFGFAIFAAVLLTVWIGTKSIAKSDKQDNKKALAVGTNVLIGWAIITAGMLGVLGAWLASALGFFGNA